MPAVEVQCPNCSGSYGFDSQSLGRTGRCQRCGQPFCLSRCGGESRFGVISDSGPVRPGGATDGSGPSSDSMARPPRASAELPEQFGRYRVVERLGQGGMGAVYLAHDTHLDRPVALKVPHFSPQDSPMVLDRFYGEARAAASLDHPNLCPIYDVGQVDGIPFLTMPYIEGQPLSRVIDRDHPVPQRQAAAVVRKLARAMGVAHGLGVIHRDLKPANIMASKRRELVIMDFGLARRATSGDAPLTRPGAMLGTPAYMAPEQVAGDTGAIGRGCDIYSLGVILYELLTGRRPFAGPTTMVLGLIMVAEPERPSRHRPDLDPQLEAICLKAMAKRVGDRYATMGELAAELEDYLAGGSRGPRPRPPVGSPEAAGTAGMPAQRSSAESLAAQFFAWVASEQESASALPAGPPASLTGGPDLPPRLRRSVAVSAGAALLLLGTIIYTVTNTCTVTIQVNDP
jgi:serine/threonine protein kinase